MGASGPPGCGLARWVWSGGLREIVHGSHCSLFSVQYDNLLSQFGCMQVSSSSSSHSLSASDAGLPQTTGSNIEQYIHDLDTNSFELDLEFSEDEKRLLLEKQASGNPW